MRTRKYCDARPSWCRWVVGWLVGWLVGGAEVLCETAGRIGEDGVSLGQCHTARRVPLEGTQLKPKLKLKIISL